MKIEKAIEILELYIPEPDSVGVEDSVDAIQLGIEALKCVENNRKFEVPNSVNPLPGETEK